MTKLINGINYKVLNKETKKAQIYISNYSKARDNGQSQLWSVYGNYSRQKEEIFTKWFNNMLDINGFGLYITTFSKFVFTLGFKLEQGNNTYLLYITPSENYIIEL